MTAKRLARNVSKCVGNIAELIDNGDHRAESIEAARAIQEGLRAFDEWELAELESKAAHIVDITSLAQRRTDG